MEEVLVSTKDIMTKFVIDSGSLWTTIKLSFLSCQLAADGMRKREKWLFTKTRLKRTERDVRTMEDMTKMANSIISIIKWTNDCPGSNQDGKMPILNLKVWMRGKVDKHQICFEPYRKPMASPYSETAHPIHHGREKQIFFIFL